MRNTTLFLSFVFLMIPLTLQAGQLSSAGGQGQWTSTECTAPEVPAALSKDAEAAANDLNTTVAAHNDFAAKAQSYMDCLAAESERDAQAMSRLVIDEATKKIDEMSRIVNESAQVIKTRQGD